MFASVRNMESVKQSCEISQMYSSTFVLWRLVLFNDSAKIVAILSHSFWVLKILLRIKKLTFKICVWCKE